MNLSFWLSNSLLDSFETRFYTSDVKQIIQTFENLNLGLSRDGKVELKSCFSDWHKAFEFESARITSNFNDATIKIYHIGSTSIPLIQAKPILDLLITAPSIEKIDQYQQKFEALGYEYKGEYGIQGRRYCVLYNLEKTVGFVHIHSFELGNLEIEKHLLFRDYLVAHPERAAAYQELKLDLISQSNMNRDLYTESKSSFIQKILEEAKAWQRGSVMFAQFFPMIQTHTFEMEPFLKNTQGYAFFISSPTFSGKEVITVKAPVGTLLPDSNTQDRTLNQYSGRQWYISDQDRVLSAQGGALLEGTYTFEIKTETEKYTLDFDYKKYFLMPAKNIVINDLGLNVDISWQSDLNTNTSWVFVFPVSTKNILKDLIAVSSVMHIGNKHYFDKINLKPGRYKVAIRSNQLWESGTFWGFQSEAWAISPQEFVVN